jgi:urease beta subunit
MEPGETIIPEDASCIDFNAEPEGWRQKWPGREWTRTVRVRNEGDRAIQVGSHFHFYEANPGFREVPRPPAGKVGFEPKGLVVLNNERHLTLGYRLDIPAGTAWRFEPDEECEVPLVSLSGDGTVWGLSTEGTLQKFKWTSVTPVPTIPPAGSTGWLSQFFNWLFNRGSGSTSGGA